MNGDYQLSILLPLPKYISLMYVEDDFNCPGLNVTLLDGLLVLGLSTDPLFSCLPWLQNTTKRFKQPFRFTCLLVRLKHETYVATEEIASTFFPELCLFEHATIRESKDSYM
jgi:hypothetical protein